LLAKLPNLLLFGGGVVIKINDEMIGAIGAAGAPGGDLDENCTRAGPPKMAGPVFAGIARRQGRRRRPYWPTDGRAGDELRA